jgi:hypothetical protein
LSIGILLPTGLAAIGQSMEIEHAAAMLSGDYQRGGGVAEQALYRSP